MNAPGSPPGALNRAADVRPKYSSLCAERSGCTRKSSLPGARTRSVSRRDARSARGSGCGPGGTALGGAVLTVASCGPLHALQILAAPAAQDVERPLAAQSGISTQEKRRLV